MHIEHIAAGHPQMLLTYTLANLAANQDGTAIPATANGDEWPMPYGGHIVAMAVRLSTAVTANTVTFKPTVNTTEDTNISVQLDTTNTQSHEGYTTVGKIPFDAGDRIGVVYDSHASFAPTTGDVNVVLHVVFDRVDF